jgi:hypothetical protein
MPRAKFDPELDETVAEIGRMDTPKGEIVCKIVAYNGGASKVDLKRTYKKGEDERFASLGRLAGEEITGVIDLLEKAMDWMQENGDAPADSEEDGGEE